MKIGLHLNTWGLSWWVVCFCHWTVFFSLAPPHSALDRNNRYLLSELVIYCL